jgi:DNA-binding response OmpR family regulator
LIVDDQRDLASSYKRALGDDYEIDIAVTLDEAITKIDGNRYDAVLSDLQLTEDGQEGYQVVKHARDRYGTRATIVLNTARASDDVNARGLQNGADSVLKKPALLSDLRKRLAEKYEQRQK